MPALVIAFGANSVKLVLGRMQRDHLYLWLRHCTDCHLFLDEIESVDHYPESLTWFFSMLSQRMYLYIWTFMLIENIWGGLPRVAKNSSELRLSLLYCCPNSIHSTECALLCGFMSLGSQWYSKFSLINCQWGLVYTISSLGSIMKERMSSFQARNQNDVPAANKW